MALPPLPWATKSTGIGVFASFGTTTTAQRS